jgi:hypothetical protein
VNFGRKFTLFALLVMICAVGTMKIMFISTVPGATVAISSSIELSTEEIEDSPELVLPETVVEGMSDSPAARIEIPVLMPAPAVTNFEMRVHFQEQLSSPPPSSSSQPIHRALQPHTSAAAFQLYLRRLHRLLTVPVKFLRTIFSTALKKFDRIRNVLAE